MNNKIAIDNQTLLTSIEKSIKNKTPLSVIRKGDGENVIMEGWVDQIYLKELNMNMIKRTN